MSSSSAYASSRSRLRTKPYGKRYGRHSAPNSVVGVVIGVILTAAITGVYFLAIQEHDVELSFDQQLELERQTYRIANHSMYMAKSGSDADLISALAHEDWSKVSKRIEWVVFSSRMKIEDRPTVEWTAKITSLFAEFVPPNLGVILFPCGCVVPNAFLTTGNSNSVRFGGDMECAMLPGFVFPHKYVAWTDAKPTKNHPQHCIHSAGWFAQHETKLARARQAFENFKEDVITKHAEELNKLESERRNNNNNNANS